MKLHIHFIVMLFLCFSELKAQTDFELLIPWSNDTSCVGMNISFEGDADGAFYILSNVQEFDGGPGVPIEGAYTFGTGITKISVSGEVLWNRLFDTNTMALGALEAYGRVPTKSILQLSEDQIILPFSYYNGLVFCDDNNLSYNFNRQLLSITPFTGGLENGNSFPQDTACINHKVLGIHKLNSGHFQLLYEDEFTSEYIVEEFNENLELLNSNSFASISPYTFFDQFSESLISVLFNSYSLYSYDGALLDEYSLPTSDTIYAGFLEVATSENNIAILQSGWNTGFDERVSKITVLDRSGNLVSQKYFSSTDMNDIDFINDDQLIVLADNSLHDFYDTIPLPINVRLFDLNLNLKAEKDLGVPFILPSKIKYLDTENSFVILGTRLKSLDLVNGKEADQIYFCKKSIVDLTPVGNHTPEVEKATVLVYPNPASTTVNILIKEAENSKLKIMNSSGQEFKVFNPDIEYNTNHTLYSLNTSNFPSGIYFIHIKTDSVIVVKKLIIHGSLN